MRSMFFILPALAALAAFVPSPSHADQYRWCAQYSGMDGDGGRNCGFVTFEQCMETIRGMGGYCEPNQFYTGPEQRTRKERRTQRH